MTFSLFLSTNFKLNHSDWFSTPDFTKFVSTQKTHIIKKQKSEHFREVAYHMFWFCTYLLRSSRIVWVSLHWSTSEEVSCDCSCLSVRGRSGPEAKSFLFWYPSNLFPLSPYWTIRKYLWPIEYFSPSFEDQMSSRLFACRWWNGSCVTLIKMIKAGRYWLFITRRL